MPVSVRCPGPEGGRLTTLSDLNDDILLHILRFLQPLPHLFSVARTCIRFKKLASDKRTWLCVIPNATVFGHKNPSHPSGQHPRGAFASVEVALAAARPGDTIWLAPRVEHVISNVVVHFPVHLRGGGDNPDDTRLSISKGAELGLDFRATCLIANMSIRGHQSPCIVHRAGHLRVERCKLTCLAHGLEHLTSPIVTVASSLPTPALHAAAPAASAAANRGPRLACRPGQRPCTDQHGPGNAAASSSLSSLPHEHGLASDRLPTARYNPHRFTDSAGLGKLVVCDTQLSGGGSGVKCWGTGSLQGARAIYGTGSFPFFYFEVDSRSPGEQQPTIPSALSTLGADRHTDRGAIKAISMALAGINHAKMMQLASQWEAGKVHAGEVASCASVCEGEVAAQDGLACATPF